MKKWAYYNEHDPDMAAWLRELIKGGQIAPGEVDERSIVDVEPADTLGFLQQHFFAGIGVWSYALRRAGWPDDRPVWTGSCPCQPFSQAGGKRGFDDERHLWPHFHRLIAQCRPAVVFGEQVASKDADAWIDTLQADLEAMEYAVGAVPFPAAGVGAPNRRDRLYWVADAPGREEWWLRQCGQGETGATGGRRTANERPWDHVEWIRCDDGRSRPVEPGTPTLAAGTAARVERLRGYGNGLNAEAATVFIESYIEAVAEMNAAA
jgi:DNA (cytosine-5)-methyltransferase 1